jgi:hypothetical protein
VEHAQEAQSVELAQEVHSEVVVQVVEEAAAEAILLEAADNIKKLQFIYDKGESWIIQTPSFIYISLILQVKDSHFTIHHPLHLMHWLSEEDALYHFVNNPMSNRQYFLIRILPTDKLKETGSTLSHLPHCLDIISPGDILQVRNITPRETSPVTLT